MSVFTITAGWLLIANFNTRTVAKLFVVADRRHKRYQHRDRAHCAMRSPNDTVTAWQSDRGFSMDLHDLRQIVNCTHWYLSVVQSRSDEDAIINTDYKSTPNRSYWNENAPHSDDGSWSDACIIASLYRRA